MPISGLVVSFDDDPCLRAKALKKIAGEPRIEMGAVDSLRMAIVLDTASTDEDKKLWKWLSNLPGVVFLDVVFVGTSEESIDA